MSKERKHLPTLISAHLFLARKAISSTRESGADFTLRERIDIVVRGCDVLLQR